MGIIKRTVNVVRSNLGELISQAEDPAKLAELSISDAKEAYVKLSGEASEIVANAIEAEKKYNEAEKASGEWHEVAKKALLAGNETDARDALAQEEKAKKNAENLKEARDAAKEASESVQDALMKLKARITEMEERSDAIKAKSTTAKIKEKAASLDFGAMDGVSDTFDRMEAKADKALARAQAKEKLGAISEGADDPAKSLMEKYGSGSGDADASLEKLKKELGM